ncbi:hypothetical protein BDM02DRAFT_3183416 [Thelephora ganbajun]|uniref:Uncharacterized protein n=1 Tax=Thelephora ganbajun TaxID=370292 RepID=A0ACB6ZSV1_THEGA|nr:hypothetical protein BDM02DRAFT_3183416 [Thelephora ganbajun]
MPNDRLSIIIRRLTTTRRPTHDLLLPPLWVVPRDASRTIITTTSLNRKVQAQVFTLNESIRPRTLHLVLTLVELYFPRTPEDSMTEFIDSLVRQPNLKTSEILTVSSGIMHRAVCSLLCFRLGVSVACFAVAVAYDYRCQFCSLVDLLEMLLFWTVYTFLYTAALWSHLSGPGSRYIHSTSTRIGRPAVDISHFLLSAGFPLANIPATPTFNYAPTPIEIPAPTPTPTSTRIPVPNTILFPASPLPTATLRHRALPLCYDGLHDDLPLVTGTRTVTGTTADLIVDGPGLLMRCLLVSLALASTLADYLVHIPVPSPALAWILGLVFLSRALSTMKRAAFRVVACTRVTRHGPSAKTNAEDVANSEGLPAMATPPPDNTPSTSPPSSPSTTPFRKLATTAQKQRNRVRRKTLAKANVIPAALRNNPLRTDTPHDTPHDTPPRNVPPLETAETDIRVWSVNSRSIVEYTPPIRRYKKRGSPVGDGLAALD